MQQRGKKEKKKATEKLLLEKIPQWPKNITAQKKKTVKKGQEDDTKGKKEKRQQKQNADSTGRSYSAPKPV